VKNVRLRGLGYCLLFLGCALAWTQTNTGRILGTIRDQTGAVVAGARIVITDIERGISRRVTSNEVGEYIAPDLPPGLYRIVVQAPRFKRAERPSVRVEVARDVHLDLQLHPGAPSEVVEVTDEPPLVETTNDTLGGTFTNNAINDLPLNGRDFVNLVVLRPGVQRYPGGGFLSLSSNGNLPEDNNFIVDGTDSNDPYYATSVVNAEGLQGTPATHLPIDAIQELTVEENPSAEYGWKPGAVVNIGLKSGTNSVHGSGYYFHRNDALDARNWFDKAPEPRLPLRLHQFGATIGGPLVQNRVFYFLAYEGVRDLVGNSEVLPTPVTITLGAQPNARFNSIPDAIASLALHGISVNPLSSALVGLFPQNNTSSPNISLGFPNKNREDNGLTKIDFHLGERHVLTAKYFLGDSRQTERDIPVLRPEWQSQAATRAQVAGVNWAWTPVSRWANEAKFGFNRFRQTLLTADHAKSPESYGINTGVTNPIDFGMPEVSIVGFTPLGGNPGWPLETMPNQTFQGSDNVSYIRGRHTLRFGGEVRRGSTTNLRDRFGKGRISFLGGRAWRSSEGETQSSPLEDFLAGNPGRGRIFVGNSLRHVSIKSFGAYVQDDWKVTSRFVLNLGLRYDLSSTIKERDDLLGNFDPNRGLVQVGRDVSAPYNLDANNFAPRLGLAWDVTGKAKTVIRAGGGISYAIPPISTFMGPKFLTNAATEGLNVVPTGAAGVTPGGGNIVAAATNVDLSTTPPWNSANPVFSVTNINCTPTTPCDILGVNRKLETPYVTHWNLNVQQKLTTDMSLQVVYVGNKGTKLYSIYDINQVNPEVDNGTEQFGRPFTFNCPAPVGAGVGGPCFPYLGFVNFLSNGYQSKYHALQATVTQRAWKGLSFVAGYTWSHALDQASMNRAQQPQDSLHPEREYASSDLDVRQRFTLALVYALPSRESWGQMLEGWQISSIFVVQTGMPWGVIDGFTGGSDISATGEFSDRWNFTGNPADFKASPFGPIPYVSPSAFRINETTQQVTSTDPNGARCIAAAGSQTAIRELATLGCYVEGSGILTPPAFGTFGTMGRNLFRGPGYQNWDFSVLKNWRIGDRVILQLRGEFFNILNHPNFSNPYGVGGQLGNVDPSVPTSFGLASATPDVAAGNPVMGSGGARAIQVGLKLKF
jgi:hypothetical protein